MKKILFITGTRADYGKIKSLIQQVEDSKEFEAYIFVSGMHLLNVFGSTYKEILKDGYQNVYVAFGLAQTGEMDFDLGNVIEHLSGYVKTVSPDMIIVHGDRIDALAGAVVGALNNIKVGHIEGGEVSGTIDESIRHAISKFAHLHFVCNEEAKERLIQMGEEQSRIFVLGSPDIDVMLSEHLPSLEHTKKRYGIPYEKYSIFMYHPVTTEYKVIDEKIREVIDALVDSGENYIVIYPNNDKGSEIILKEFKKIHTNKKFRIYPSLRFEYFLTLLKHAEFMIGNSSAGVRESSVYGIPSIDIGTRQNGRYSLKGETNIQHVEEDKRQILSAIDHYKDYKKTIYHFGDGKSSERFREILNEKEVWKLELQKKFIDLNSI